MNFEELLKEIDALPEAQKQIIRGRLSVTEADDRLQAAGEQDSLSAYRAKLYQRARKYWQSVGDSVRLALTDSELDEQFWLFDGDNIPRLQEDKSQVEIPANSSVRLGELAASANIRTARPLDAVQADDVLNEEYADYLLKRMSGNHNGSA